MSKDNITFLVFAGVCRRVKNGRTNGDNNKTKNGRTDVHCSNPQ
jgi:hypothetical protein